MLFLQDHPFLGLPFFMIHPCNTATLMARAFSDVDDTDGSERVRATATTTSSSSQEVSVKISGGKVDHFLLTWLSTVGPLVGLSVEMSLAKDWLDSQ
jgi:hypothetical protein